MSHQEPNYMQGKLHTFYPPLRCSNKNTDYRLRWWNFMEGCISCLHLHENFSAMFLTTYQFIKFWCDPAWS